MTTVATLAANLALESASFESGAQRARREMQSLQRSIAQDTSRISASLNTAGVAVANFARSFVIASAATGILGGIALATRAAINEFAEGERAAQKLNAVLRATGNTAGLSADQIISFSESIERSTNTSAESIQEAASILATFQSVSGDTFTRTIALANDLASVFGGDVVDATRQLGKALEDPIAGVNLLDRAYRSFSDQQKQFISDLVESGQVAEAQRVILARLEEQVGGAAGAGAKGLTGAFERLGIAIVNTLGDMVSWIAEATNMETHISRLAKGFEVLGGFVSGEKKGPSGSPDIGKRIAELKAQRDELRAWGSRPQVPLDKAFNEAEIRKTEAEIANLTRLLAAQEQAEANSAEAIARTNVIRTEQNAILARQPPILKTATVAANAETVAIEEATNKRESANAELARENRLRAAGINLIEDMNQRRADEERYFTELGNEFRAEQQKRADFAQKTTEEATAAAQAAAEDQAEAIAAPFNAAAASIGSLFADTFEGIITGALTDFEDFADQAAKIVISIPSQILGASISGALNAAINSAIQQTVAQSAAGGGGAGPFGALGNFARANPALAAFGIGTIAGGIGNQLIGGNAQFGALGGGIGAALGSFFGPVGSVLGGLGGSLLGGLFGGGQNLGNDRAGLHYQLGRGITWEDRNSSRENREAIHRVASQLDDVERILARQGAAYTGPEFSISAGNKTGYEFHFAQGGLAKRTYDTIEELIAGLIETIGDRITGGMSDTLKTILDNTKAQNAAELQAELEFAEAYDRLVKGPQSEFKNALDALNESFADAKFTAEEYGLSVAKLTEAQDKAQQDLYDEFEKNLTTRQEDASSQIRNFFESLLEPLETATGAFGIGQGIISPVVQAEVGLEEFRETFARARAGDIEALQEISSLGQAVVQAQREIGASGAESAAIYREVNAALLSLRAELENQQIAALQNLVDESQLTVKEQTDRMVEELREIQEELAALRRDRLLVE